MAVIVVRCPKTRRDILPGVEIAKADFRPVPSVVRSVKCPVCDEEHLWLPYAARMAEALAIHSDSAPSIDPSPDRPARSEKPARGRGTS